MASYGAPNARQLEILGWIGEGCPEREWPDFTYKTSAVALQSRGLAQVSKRGGTWSATITEAGRRILAGEPYESVRPSRAKAPSSPSSPTRSAPTAASIAADADSRRRRAMAANLLARLAEAGGSLEIPDPTERERAEIRQGVSAVDATRSAPAGKVLRSSGTTRGTLKVWLASPSAVDMPISPRQYDVMEWVQDGCPERADDASMYRAATRQLHNRGLLHVTGSGANLTAAVTPLGKQVMTRQRSEIERRRRQEQAEAERVAAQRREEEERRQFGIDLITKVAAAGGRLDVGRRLGRYELSQVVGALRGNHGLPTGQRLAFEPTMMDERLGFTVYFAPDFDVQVEPTTVLVPAQLRQPSTAVVAFRERRAHVTKDSIPRAARILQAVVDAAEERSWTVHAYKSGYYNRGDDSYDITIEIDRMSWNLLIRERNGRNARDHRAYVSNYWDSYRNARPGETKMVRNREFEATGTLILELHKEDSHSSSLMWTWNDDKKRTLEEQLPSLFRRLDVAAAENDWERQEAERRRGLTQQRWAQIRAAAVEKYRYAKRAEQLEVELERRESARQMRAYADEITAQASDRNGEGRADARAWADWIRGHASKIDPLNAAELRPPTFDDFTDTDLQPWLGGWTAYGPPGGRGSW